MRSGAGGQEISLKCSDAVPPNVQRVAWVFCVEAVADMELLTTSNIVVLI